MQEPSMLENIVSGMKRFIVKGTFEEVGHGLTEEQAIKRVKERLEHERMTYTIEEAIYDGPTFPQTT